MKIKDLQFENVSMPENDKQVAHYGDFGTITVINRMTGFGFRDTETGFRDTDGRFWLAAGGLDIRDFGGLDIGDAINKIKNEANICMGERHLVDISEKHLVKAPGNMKARRVSPVQKKLYSDKVLSEGIKWLDNLD